MERHSHLGRELAKVHDRPHARTSMVGEIPLPTPEDGYLLADCRVAVFPCMLGRGYVINCPTFERALYEWMAAGIASSVLIVHAVRLHGGDHTLNYPLECAWNRKTRKWTQWRTIAHNLTIAEAQA